MQKGMNRSGDWYFNYNIDFMECEGLYRFDEREKRLN
jgi:hypothetical protein